MLLLWVLNATTTSGPNRAVALYSSCPGSQVDVFNCTCPRSRSHKKKLGEGTSTCYVRPASTACETAHPPTRPQQLYCNIHCNTRLGLTALLIKSISTLFPGVLSFLQSTSRRTTAKAAALVLLALKLFVPTCAASSTAHLSLLNQSLSCTLGD